MGLEGVPGYGLQREMGAGGEKSQMLRAWECQLGQGALFAKPLMTGVSDR